MRSWSLNELRSFDRRCQRPDRPTLSHTSVCAFVYILTWANTHTYTHTHRVVRSHAANRPHAEKTSCRDWNHRCSSERGGGIIASQHTRTKNNGRVYGIHSEWLVIFHKPFFVCWCWTVPFATKLGDLAEMFGLSGPSALWLFFVCRVFLCAQCLGTRVRLIGHLCPGPYVLFACTCCQQMRRKWFNRRAPAYLCWLALLLSPAHCQHCAGDVRRWRRYSQLMRCDTKERGAAAWSAIRIKSELEIRQKRYPDSSHHSEQDTYRQVSVSNILCIRIHDDT